MLRIIADFQGASLGPQRIDGTSIYTRIREETPTCADGLCHDYAWHFCFGIANDASESENVRIFIHPRRRDVGQLIGVLLKINTKGIVGAPSNSVHIQSKSPRCVGSIAKTKTDYFR